MARRGKTMNLGEFLGDSAASYIPEAALPTGPRARDEFEDDRRGGYGDRRGGYDREPSRSEQSDQWRGDRGGDRFDRGGGDRFGSRGPSRFDEGGDSNWRGGGRDAGPSRYDRPSRDNFREPEERPAHMRLNLQRRGEGTGPSSPRRSGDDKFASAFGSRGGGAGGSGMSRFGGDRDGGSRFGGDRFGDRDGGSRFGGDRYGDRDGGSRFGGDRYGDRDGGRFGGDRFGRGGDRYDDRDGGRFGDRFGRRDDGPSSISGAFNSLRVQDAPAPVVDEEQDKKAKAQKLREERKKKAEEERLAAEEAKRKAAEEKKAAEEAAAKKAVGDKAIMAKIIASGKKGDELVAVAKDVFKAEGRAGGAAIIEAVTKAAEDVAKASANWIAPKEYGQFLKFALADAPVAEQVQALYALQLFLNTHDFPKGVIEKCFMALYSLDIIEEKAFLDYKYDVDNDLPGRMKAIVQTSSWLTWLETPESDSEEEDDE